MTLLVTGVSGALVFRLFTSEARPVVGHWWANPVAAAIAATSCERHPPGWLLGQHDPVTDYMPPDAVAEVVVVLGVIVLGQTKGPLHHFFSISADPFVQSHTS